MWLHPNYPGGLGSYAAMTEDRNGQGFGPYRGDVKARMGLLALKLVLVVFEDRFDFIGGKLDELKVLCEQKLTYEQSWGLEK